MPGSIFEHLNGNNGEPGSTRNETILRRTAIPTSSVIQNAMEVSLAMGAQDRRATCT